MSRRRNPFRYFSILQKQILLIAIPLICSLILCSWFIRTQREVLDELNKVDVIASYTLKAQNLMNALHQERANAALYLGSKGQRQAQELSQSQVQTNKAAQELKQSLDSLAEEFRTEELISYQEFIYNNLTNLEETRTRIKSLSIEFETMLDTYALIDDKLYDLISLWDTLGAEESVENPITSYGCLVDYQRAFEASRTIILYVYSSKDFSMSLFERLISRDANQKINAGFIDFYSSKEQLLYWNQHSEHNEESIFPKIKNLFSKNGQGYTDSLDQLIGDLSLTSKQHIALENDFRKQVFKAEAITKAKHRQDLFASIWLISIITVITLIISIMIIASLESPIRRLLQVLNQVAAGNLNIRSAISGRDELSQISKTLDQTLDALRLAYADANKSLQIINTLDAGIFQVDLEGSIIFANKTAGELATKLQNQSPVFGSSNFINRNIVDLFNNNRKLINHINSSSQLAYEETIKIGNESIHLKASPILTEDHNLSSYIITWRLNSTVRQS